jgi:hypothetical protein
MRLGPLPCALGGIWALVNASRCLITWALDRGRTSAAPPGVPERREPAEPPGRPGRQRARRHRAWLALVLNSTLQTVGGTSGSAPFTAAATALVDGSERAAGRPRIGLANGWSYQAAAQPSAFFDVTTGSNDIAGVGCCQATVGYDLATGLGVPNWAALPANLPEPR